MKEGKDRQRGNQKKVRRHLSGLCRVFAEKGTTLLSDRPQHLLCGGRPRGEADEPAEICKDLHKESENTIPIRPTWRCVLKP